MATLTNAAGRLHALLLAAAQIPPNTVARDAWHQLLALEGSAAPELLRRLADVFALPSAAEGEIRQLDDDHEPLLVWVEPVHRAFFATHLNAPWHHFRTHFDTDTAPLAVLNVAASLIARQLPQPAIEPDVLVDLRNHVREVKDEAIAAEMDVELRDFILLHLRHIEYAIETYQVRGSAGLLEAVQNACGGLLIRPGVTAKASQSGAGKLFGQLLRRILLVVSVTADVYTLAGAAGQLLLPPTTQESARPNGSAPPPMVPEGSEPVTPVPDTVKGA